MYSRPFQSALVLRTLAYHLEATSTAVDYCDDAPRGALGLSVVAVERAIHMFRTGSYVPADKNDKFSEALWGDALDSYKISIQKLRDVSWDRIVDGADALREAQTPTRPAPVDNANTIDERAMVNDDSEDDKFEEADVASGDEQATTY